MQSRLQDTDGVFAEVKQTMEERIKQLEVYLS